MWLWEQLQEAAFASRSTTVGDAIVENPAASISIVERVFILHTRKLLLLEIEREAEREIENLAR